MEYVDILKVPQFTLLQKDSRLALKCSSQMHNENRAGCFTDPWMDFNFDSHDVFFLGLVTALNVWNCSVRIDLVFSWFQSVILNLDFMGLCVCV